MDERNPKQPQSDHEPKAKPAKHPTKDDDRDTRAHEHEPLDEDSLEHVMRECPL